VVYGLVVSGVVGVEGGCVGNEDDAMASWARWGGLKEESRTAMCGIELVFSLAERGQLGGAYKSVNGAAFDVA
jgi:hypothetical protein